MYRILQTKRFKKDIRKLAKAGPQSLDKTFDVLIELQKGGIIISSKPPSTPIEREL